MPEPQTPLVGLIADLPDGLLPRIRRGFDVFSRLPDSTRSSAVLKFLDSFEQSSENLESNWLDQITTIAPNDSNALLTALSVAVGTLSQTSVSAEEFLVAGRGKLFDEVQAPIALEIARIIVRERPRLEQTIARRTLSAETLPALDRFDVSVDFRFRFGKDNAIVAGVPVAIVHIDTDAPPELFFQMSRGDVEMVVDKLNIVLKQMAAAAAAFKKSDVSS
jgi:hypothetical protein